MVFTEGAVVPGLGLPLLLIYQYISLQAQSTRLQLALTVWLTKRPALIGTLVLWSLFHPFISFHIIICIRNFRLFQKKKTGNTNYDVGSQIKKSGPKSKDWEKILAKDFSVTSSTKPLSRIIKSGISEKNNLRKRGHFRRLIEYFLIHEEKKSINSLLRRV